MTRGWSLFWGLVLVLIGGLALLFNLGFLQPEQLSRLVELWPLLLILVGLQIVLARALPRNVAAIAVSVITFLLVAGSVGYVVTAPPAHDQHREVTVTDRGTGPAKLQVNLGAGQIQIEYGSPAGGIATAALDYRGGTADLTWDARTRILDVSRSSSGGGLFSSVTPDRLTVTLDSSITWSTVLNAGASTTTLKLAAPVGHERISLNGGATELKIERPAGAALGVDVSGGANSISVDGRNVGSALGSTTWNSEGFPAADEYDVSVNGGANRVTVTTVG